MAFTTEEITAAVQQLVRTSVRRPYDDTGVRRSDITFSDMNDAAAGVYVLYPNALYYTAKLCTDKLAKAVEANQNLLTSFMGYVSAVARHVQPVTQLNSLMNARVALQELASSSLVRESGFRTITETSAYQRFNDNTQRFLDDAGGAVVSHGEVVPTPNEAREQFASTFDSLQDGFIDVVSRVGVLAHAVDDFDSMSLPATLFGGIVSNSQALIQSEFNKLSAMTPEERLTIIRNTVLNVLATRSTVAGFGSLSSPGMFYLLTGMGGPYASPAYPPIHASLVSEYYGPFNILGTANELDLRLDGDTAITTNVKVQPSFVPFLNGMAKEDFVITTTPIDNTKFSLGLRSWPSLGSVTIVDVVQVAGTYDAYEISSAINAAINALDPTMPLLAEPYCNPLRYSGNFDIALVSPTECTFTAVYPPAVDFVAVGITTGDSIIIRDPTCSADRAVFHINTVNTSSLRGVLVHGALITETNKLCNVSSGKLALNLRITDHTDYNISKPDYRLQALDDRVSILTPQQGAGTIDDQFNGCTALGYLPVMEAVARPTPASEVVLTYNAQPGAAVNGVARTKASALFTPSTFQGAGRTDPYNPLVFVAYKYQATCNMTTPSFGVVVFDCTKALSAGVAVGDILVMRKSATPGNVNHPILITAVDDASITAAATVLAGETGVDIEVGDNFSRDDTLDAALMVSGGTANDGEYVVRNQNTIPFELTVNSVIAVPYGVGNLPITCTLAMGRHAIKFESLKEDLTAQIFMAHEYNPKSAFFTFFAVTEAGSKDAYGLANYYKPPSLPKGLDEGDMLELYEMNLTPTYEGTIVRIDATTGVVELDIPLPVTTLSMPFTKDSPVPFARIRRQHTDNFEIFSSSLLAWLNELNLDQNFMDLTRVLNALLVNKNPTPSQVNNAQVQLASLNNVMLDLSTILATYEAPVVEQVDALVRSFLEKGADRAVDTLLSCRFTEFFGLTQDGLSYGAYVQSTIKEVQNNDLPIRKFDRLTRHKAEQALLAQWDEQDFEFSKGDADPEVPYDPPGTADFIVS